MPTHCCVHASSPIVSSKLDVFSYVKDDSLVFDTNDLPGHPVDLGPYHISLSKEGTFYTFNASSNTESNNRVMMLIENKEDEQSFVEMYTSLNNHFIADFSYDGRFESAEHSHNITMPACLPNMVSIGALNCREYYVNMEGDTIAGHAVKTPHGTLAAFSSVGPTFDGLMKPDARIFEAVLRNEQARPDETVFIDDGPRNVATAAALGMHTLQPDNGGDWHAMLEQLIANHSLL